MKNNGFYNSIVYKERQSEIARKNWQIGIYDFLRKQEKRQCINPNCRKWFEAQLADPKKFCSRKCAAQVNNPKRSTITPKAKKEIISLYQKGLSMQEISDKTGRSLHQVIHYLDKYNIPRRSPSEAAYAKWNPNGDPFKIKKKLTRKDLELKGLGVGLYWGEGNKNNRWSVKVGNTDVKLIKKFREFLLKICGVKEEKIKYALQAFNDANPKKALKFWAQELKIPREKIGKIMILPPMGKGTYKKKSQYGVLSISVHNMKLKNKLDEWVEESVK